MSDSIVCIFNPSANQGKANTLESDLRRLAEAHPNTEWIRTARPHQAEEIVISAASQGCKRVIALGGDGTVNEVVNGLMLLPPEHKPELAVVPIGTGNEVARNLDISENPREALLSAFEGVLGQMDVGYITLPDSMKTSYWLNTAGIGLDAIVSTQVHELPPVRADIGYWSAFFYAIVFNHTPFHIEAVLDSQPISANTLMFVACNGRKEGKLIQIAPNAQCDDGVLEYSMLRAASRWQVLVSLPFFMLGKQSVLPYVSGGSFQTLTLKSKTPLTIHADGETLCKPKAHIHRVEIGVLPRAIKIVLPETKTAPGGWFSLSLRSIK
jgi:YegS/Rv2252/BmrU family lipid kinase